MSDLRNVPGIGAKKEQALIALGCDSLEKLIQALLTTISAVDIGTIACHTPILAPVASTTLSWARGSIR